jgi:hypothetical protein
MTPDRTGTNSMSGAEAGERYLDRQLLDPGNAKFKRGIQSALYDLAHCAIALVVFVANWPLSGLASLSRLR